MRCAIRGTSALVDTLHPPACPSNDWVKRMPVSWHRKVASWNFYLCDSQSARQCPGARVAGLLGEGGKLRREVPSIRYRACSVGDVYMSRQSRLAPCGSLPESRAGRRCWREVHDHPKQSDASKAAAYRAGGDHDNDNSVRGPILHCESYLIFGGAKLAILICN